jgi:hypothetical protein
MQTRKTNNTFLSKQLFAFINVSGITTRVGPTRSKQNELESQVTIFLTKQFISEEIVPDNITILSEYMASTALIRMAIAFLNNTQLSIRGMEEGRFDYYSWPVRLGIERQKAAGSRL